MSELKQCDKVWVSDESTDHAEKIKAERDFVGMLDNGDFICKHESRDTLIEWSYAIKIPEPKIIPFTAETFPKGMVWIREKDWDNLMGLRSLVTSISSGVVSYDNNSQMEYESMINDCETSLDGGKTWQVAGIEESV